MQIHPFTFFIFDSCCHFGNCCCFLQNEYLPLDVTAIYHRCGKLLGHHVYDKLFFSVTLSSKCLFHEDSNGCYNMNKSHQ